MNIQFAYVDIPFRLKQSKKLKKWLTNILQRNSLIPESICYIFCDDEYLLNINRSYLKHDYYTDTITFPYSDVEKQHISGDIFISVTRVKENANTLKIPFNIEVSRIILHSLLHLMGYTDSTPHERAQMTKLEDLYLSELNNNYTF